MSPTTPRSTPKPDAKDEKVETRDGVQVLCVYEDALEVGYQGEATDQWPNEAYTVAGVIQRAQDNPPDVTVEADPDHGGDELGPKK
jgi:hypothetical protein